MKIRQYIPTWKPMPEPGKVWRLHTGKDARVVYEWTPDKECEDSE